MLMVFMAIARAQFLWEESRNKVLLPFFVAFHFFSCCLLRNAFSLISLACVWPSLQPPTWFPFLVMSLLRQSLCVVLVRNLDRFVQSLGNNFWCCLASLSAASMSCDCSLFSLRPLLSLLYPFCLLSFVLLLACLLCEVPLPQLMGFPWSRIFVVMESGDFSTCRLSFSIPVCYPCQRKPLILSEMQRKRVKQEQSRGGRD